MHYVEKRTEKGVISLIEFEEVEVLTDYAALFDAMMSAPTNIVAINRQYVSGEFFDLKSGLAGAVLQKASIYRRTLLFFGDFSQVHSKSLRDFIFESNKTGKIVFAPTWEEGVKLLRV